ncbi:MAG: DUF373 family protein [Methanobacteriota archaeon]
MPLLVLCVDRDDDLGRKAGVRGPIVGRPANLAAATQLLVADPEESDANSIFGAINILDEIVNKGEAAEIATITGSVSVGPTSDRILSGQLDTVLSDLKPDRCIFVTDGAEDEYLLPIVTSRVRVDSVRRIIVKQNQDVESTYYVIKKALEDDKFQRAFFVPMALGFLVYGLAAVSGYPDKGLGAISITIGTYFILKALHVGDLVRGFFRDVWSGFTHGNVALFTSLLALFVVIAAGVSAVNSVSGEATTLDAGLAVVSNIVWWLVVAGLVAASGKVLDSYTKRGRVLWNYWIIPFTLVSIGFFVTSAVGIVRNLLEGRFPFGGEELKEIALGVGILFVGTATNTVIRATVGHAPRVPEPESEIPEPR